MFSLIVSLCSAAEPKRAPLLPKNGIKTPGIQIPAANLQPEAEFKLTGAPAGVAFTDKVYLAVREAAGWLPVVTKTNKAEDLIPGVKDACAGAVSAFGGLWTASCSEGKLSKYDPRGKKFTTTVDVPVADLPRGLAANADSLWVLSDARTTLSRVDPEAGRVVAEVRLSAGCNSILSAENALWVTCPAEDRLLKINPQTNLVDQRIEVAGEPVATTFGEGSIWVLTKKEGKLIRIDPRTNKPTATIELKTPGVTGTLAFGEGTVWVSTPEFPVTRIDLATDKVMQQFTGEAGGDIYAGAGSVWLADAKGRVLRRYDPKRIRATLAE